jgi:thiamine biosynthesis protein ThiS
LRGDPLNLIRVMPAKGEERAGISKPNRPLFIPRPAARQEWSVAGVRLTVNGEEREVAAATTVEALVALLGLDRRKLAVERNLEIVPRSLFAATRLVDGDRIEIVAFVGGG